jgi:hypothetical protein
VVGVSGLVALPATPDVLDAASDPAAFVVAAVSHARSWLEQARTVDLPHVVEAKARAEAVRSYVAQKELGREAELAAAEIVRRAERRIGELTREGQASGEIRRRGEHTKAKASDEVHSGSMNSSGKRSTRAIYRHDAERADIYAMTDGVSAEQFDEAVDQAKSEGNLSRTNVVRKVRALKGEGADAVGRRPRSERVEQIRALADEGRSSPQIGAALGIGTDHVRRMAVEAGIRIPADVAIGRARRIDPNRIVREAVTTLEGVVATFELVELEQLEREAVAGWATSLRRSVREVQRFIKEMTK